MKGLGYGWAAGRHVAVLIAVLGLAACNDEGPSGIASASSGLAQVATGTSGNQGMASNAAPAISGGAASNAKVGQTYVFAPTASDPDGDSVGFTITNKPAWASFNTTTGRLTGTPLLGDVGTYSNIMITVSDGVATTRLGPFAITVNTDSAGAANLSWIPPTEYTDGQPLLNLAGYYVYYSKQPDARGGQKVVLDNPGLTRYLVENLDAGTWYFTITAFTAAGTESDFSAIASKTII